MVILIKKISYLNIRKDEIREFLKYLDSNKYSRNTVSRILSSLRGFYNYLETVFVFCCSACTLIIYSELFIAEFGLVVTLKVVLSSSR